VPWCLRARHCCSGGRTGEAKGRKRDTACVRVSSCNLNSCVDLSTKGVGDRNPLQPTGFPPKWVCANSPNKSCVPLRSSYLITYIRFCGPDLTWSKPGTILKSLGGGGRSAQNEKSSEKLMGKICVPTSPLLRAFVRETETSSPVQGDLDAIVRFSHKGTETQRKIGRFGNTNLPLLNRFSFQIHC
jgi:hypothetical protein